MTQYLATCQTCGGKVSHLEEHATVETCDACKGDPKFQTTTPKKEK